jgi:AcrR family transcriptional regulator
MARPKGKTLTPQDILDVALVLLEAQGVEDFNINQLAKVLAIKPPSLYNHFAGDEDLRRTIRLEGWKRLAQALPEIHSHDHPLDLIRRTAYRYREFALENPALYLFTTQFPFPSRDEQFVAQFAIIEELLVTMVIPFGLGPMDTRRAARLLYASLQGLLLSELLGPFEAEQTAMQEFNWALDRLINQLLGPRMF